MVEDPISLLFSANNNKVCFIWIELGLLDSTQNKISVRHSLKVEINSCAFDCESDM